jgi:hypothetical protein
LHKQGPDSAEAFCSPAAMAVRTDDLAFLDLIENALPVAVGQLSANVEALVSDVVELKDQWILFTAVNTRVRLEVPEQETHPLLCTSSLPLSLEVDVALPVGGVVLLSIGGSTGSAVRVDLATGHISASEVSSDLHPAAP